MDGVSLPFRVKLAADDPNADPYEVDVTVGPGIIALWEIEGWDTGKPRTIEKLDEGSLVDVSWLIWAALGRPNDTFTTFLPRLLDVESKINTKAGEPNPKA